jgi:hypothetical protein
MIHLVGNIRKTRILVLDLIKELSLEKLNKIPHGFNNNIFWNAGHLVAAQQTICYLRGGHSLRISEDFFNNFKPGSRPERFFQSDEEDEMKKLLFGSLDILENDLQQNKFEPFTPWITRTGININNIGQALIYLHHHEGLHTGIIYSMKKMVQK